MESTLEERTLPNNLGREIISQRRNMDTHTHTSFIPSNCQHLWRSTPCWLYPTCHAIPSVARQDSVLLYLCMVPQTSILCVQNSQHHSVKHPPVEVVWVEAAGWMDGLYLSHVLTNTHKGVRPRASCATLDADFWLRSWMVTPQPMQTV